MTEEDILGVDVPEDVSEVPTDQLEEWHELADEVRGKYHKRRNYYEKTARKSDSDEKVEWAEKALELKSKARYVKSQLKEEVQRREINIDDRDHIRATYLDEHRKLTYIDEERVMKIRIDVEEIEYRISESLGKEVMSDDMHGKDVHVETEVLAPDRFLIVASEGSRQAQIEVSGNTTTHLEE